MNTVAVTSMQLKSALQAGKQGVLKPGDTTGKTKDSNKDSNEAQWSISFVGEMYYIYYFVTCTITGLKIMPIANMGPNAKILPKPPGSGPIYVVSSTSSASPTVSMVTRTVPSGIILNVLFGSTSCYCM